MTALDPPVARRAAADVDAEPSHDRADGGEIFLVLIGHARLVHGPATVGAPRWKRRLVGLVDARRHGPLTVASMRGPRLAARALRVRRGRALRERGRLARAGAPRGVQIVFQPLVLAAQPITLAQQIGTLAFDASQFLAQANVVATGAHPFVAQRVIGQRGTVETIGHASFMPVPGLEYKYGILDRSVTIR